MQRGIHLLPESPRGSDRKSRGFRRESRGEGFSPRARARDYIIRNMHAQLSACMADIGTVLQRRSSVRGTRPQGEEMW